jgi:hypothetical protein
MSTGKRYGMILLASGLIAAAAAAHYHCSRPRLPCFLPRRDYQYRRFSQSVRALSATPVVLREPAADAGPAPSGAVRFSPRRGVKSFQFVDRPVLRIDHCYLSKMSVLLHETGEWTLSLQADQNPLQSPAEVDRKVTTREEGQKFTDHLRRNQFFVQLRCYGRYGPSTENDLLGRPVIIPVHIEPFWVQNARPYAFFKTGCEPRIAEFYAEIDRVEIEFWYRRD